MGSSHCPSFSKDRGSDPSYEQNASPNCVFSSESSEPLQPTWPMCTKTRMQVLTPVSPDPSALVTWLHPFPLTPPPSISWLRTLSCGFGSGFGFSTGRSLFWMWLKSPGDEDGRNAPKFLELNLVEELVIFGAIRSEPESNSNLNLVWPQIHTDPALHTHYTHYNSH